MRDLYKVANFPVIEDIFGEECYVSETRKDEKFDIEIQLGRPIESTIGAKRIIFTQVLKEFILATQNVPLKKFAGVISGHTITSLRRKLKANPYKTYQDWIASNDPHKPKEITILDTKIKPEYLTDYFGTVYIILSAKVSDDGFIYPMGISKDIYDTKSKKSKKYILTSQLVERIKKYRFYPHKGIHEFPFDMQTFIVLKKELGYRDSISDGINSWLAAHLNKIITMTAENFTKDYASLVSISQNSIATVKTSCHHLVQYKKRRDSHAKEILKLLRKYEKRKDKETQKKLTELLGISKFRDDFRAFQILILAKKLNHPIPKLLKNI